MLVCGVDEAGRGPAIGPMVVAAVAIESRRMGRLRRLGVRSSKDLSPARREELYGEIIDAADSHAVSVAHPRKIDSHVRRHALNEMEAALMAGVISRLMPGRAHVDACDVNARRFGMAVAARLSGGCAARILSSHRADDEFPVVSAASIIAKVRRDREISKIRRTHSVGSGYPSDPACTSFLEAHARENGAPPSFARATWLTVRRIYGLPAPAPAQRRGRGRTAQAPLTPPRQTRLQSSQSRRQ